MHLYNVNKMHIYVCGEHSTTLSAHIWKLKGKKKQISTLIAFKNLEDVEEDKKNFPTFVLIVS